ncbi:MAG: hypothetical protein CML05_15520 [Pseudozobellia sp.]|nr:hypothetical protein [Pseudozobellia sp.]|tara:strand:- start:47 stop:487 length:441 start_codon:yes stop_codon:yes gene_type:complete
MEHRIQIEQLQPQAYKAMFGLEGYLSQSELTKSHKELIKIRASQINKCAFCIDMHTKDALKNGESQKRIFLLDAWRESNLFTKEEQTILAITEELTLIHEKGLTDETYKKALEVFSETYLAQIIMAATVINAWNRLAISTHKPIMD